MAVVVPTRLVDALDALDNNPDLMIVNGGTDFMVEVNFRQRRPESLLSLRRVEELRGWAMADGVVRVEAGTTCRSMEAQEFVAVSPVLAQAARTVGSPQIRNAATLGGNLATASPAGDMVAALVALDASIEVASSRGVRTIGARNFALSPKRNALVAGELITAVLFAAATGPQEFMKVGTRNAMVIAVANVALVVEQANAASPDVRLALGSVGPTVLRATESEAWIATHVDWDAQQIVGDPQEFASLVASESRPIDDHRATAAYRRHAIGICARRSLIRAIEAGVQ